MDLGIAGRRALVCAASKGLGRGCAEALAREGVLVTIVARTEATVRRTAEEIGARAGRTVAWVAVRHHHGRRPRRRAGGVSAPRHPRQQRGRPAAGRFPRLGPRHLAVARIDANMLTPIELIKATVDGMIARKFGRIVNITSSAVKAPIDVLGLSNGARSGLTGFVAGLARKVARHNVTINNLLPGFFDTDRLRGTMAGAREGAGQDRRRGDGRGARGQSLPAASAMRRSSARCARSSAAPTPATSSARTS